MTAIQYASAGLVALLLYLYPAFVAALSVLFLKERLTPTRLAALVLATVGAALTADPQGGQVTGILLAISSSHHAVYTIVGAGGCESGGPAHRHLCPAGLVFGLLTLLTAALAPTAGLARPPSPSFRHPVVTFLAGLRSSAPLTLAAPPLEPVVTVLLAARWRAG
jgi:drug/metabolite transporter (DMT)-like permease